jgi:hypothetical protein
MSGTWVQRFLDLHVMPEGYLSPADRDWVRITTNFPLSKQSLKGDLPPKIQFFGFTLVIRIGRESPSIPHYPNKTKLERRNKPHVLSLQ